jgi:hypothetical protein
MPTNTERLKERSVILDDEDDRLVVAGTHTSNPHRRS